MKFTQLKLKASQTALLKNTIQKQILLQTIASVSYLGTTWELRNNSAVNLTELNSLYLEHDNERCKMVP